MQSASTTPIFRLHVRAAYGNCTIQLEGSSERSKVVATALVSLQHSTTLNITYPANVKYLTAKVSMGEYGMKAAGKTWEVNKDTENSLEVKVSEGVLRVYPHDFEIGTSGEKSIFLLPFSNSGRARRHCQSEFRTP